MKKLFVLIAILIILFTAVFFSVSYFQPIPDRCTITKTIVGWDNSNPLNAYRLETTEYDCDRKEIHDILVEHKAAIFNADWKELYFDVVDTTQVALIERDVNKWIERQLKKDK